MKLENFIVFKKKLEQIGICYDRGEDEPAGLLVNYRA